MFERLPNRVELGIFAAMALVGALIVGLVPKHDYAMMFAVMPVFLVAAVMGFLRSERLKMRQAEAAKDDQQAA